MSYPACRRIIEEQHRRLVAREDGEGKDALELARVYGRLYMELTFSERMALARYRMILYEQAESDGLLD